MATPSTAPVPHRIKLSARSDRLSVARLAPSALRTDSSASRLTVRASMRLATFAQAITKTRPDAASRTSSTVFARAVI